MSKGRLLVIEGLDGSGKATQAKLLAAHLAESGRRVMEITFPDYESDSSALVKMYLSGRFGDKPSTIYQGVTLGGVGTRKGKRHPTLGSNVMVGAGAKILGAFEVGDNCSIAANAVLLKPLEDNVTAVGIPARPVKKDGVTIPKNKRSLTLEEYEDMRNRMEQMEQEIADLKQALAARGTEVPSRKDAGQGIQDKETQEKPYQS